MVIDDPATLAEVTAAFGSCERALMVNDAATPDAPFRELADAVRSGVGQNPYGAAAAFRRQRAGGAPRYTPSRTITTYGRDLGTACTENVPAGSSIVGWHILAAHVFQMADVS